MHGSVQEYQQLIREIYRLHTMKLFGDGVLLGGKDPVAVSYLWQKSDNAYPRWPNITGLMTRYRQVNHGGLRRATVAHVRG